MRLNNATPELRLIRKLIRYWLMVQQLVVKQQIFYLYSATLFFILDCK